MRRLLRWSRLLPFLLGLALCGAALAAAPPLLELTATPAWKGWSRPGRASELDIRIRSDVATRATLEVSAGQQTLRAELELEAGRVLRLQLPVSATAGLAASATAAAASAPRREIAVALSESPVLGVGLASEERVRLEGFHSLALSADDLPRHASAYASVDALILDAPTLRALDPRQLAALLSHAAACGRIAVVNTDERLRRLLEGAGGCGGRALVSAPSLAEAQVQLSASLARSLPTAMSPGSVGELARPGHEVWNRVAVLLAVYVAIAALAWLFFTGWPVLLGVPALAAVVVLGTLHALPPPPQLLIWSEGDAGAPLARYQAWQRFPGLVRERQRVAVPPQLAGGAQPCDARQALRVDFDALRGRISFVEFDTRLFGQVSLCYAGSFPMARAPVAAMRADGALEVRNAGNTAWPAGRLLADGQVYGLPALAPAAQTTLAANSGQAAREPVLRLAATRTPPQGAVALWALELGGVAEVPAASQGWLLVTVAAP